MISVGSLLLFSPSTGVSISNPSLPLSMDSLHPESSTLLSNGPETTTSAPPANLTTEEYAFLRPVIEAHHTYPSTPGRCFSLLSQRITAPASTVWSIVRRFDRPQTYKHFIRSCTLLDPCGRPSDVLEVGCLRELSVISGIPAYSSTERLDVLDERRRIFGFTIIGGEHRLRNYRSITTVNEMRPTDADGGPVSTVVLESYIVDVPEGNTDDDTRLFADTVIRLNLQKLASLSESLATTGGRSSS